RFAQLEPAPIPEGGGGAPYVDRHVEHGATSDPDQLRLRGGGKLIVQPSQHSLSRRRMVVLDEPDLTTQPGVEGRLVVGLVEVAPLVGVDDRKSKRLNSSHITISYAVFC